jgi:hypothetical protein
MLLVFLLSDLLREQLCNFGLDMNAFARAEGVNGRTFFELKPQAIQVPWVGLNEKVGIKAKAAMCPRCGTRSFVFAHRERPRGTRAYVRESQIVRLTADVAVAGALGAPQPIFRGAAYAALLTHRTLKGVRFEPVGVVPDADIKDPVPCDPIPARKQR